SLFDSRSGHRRTKGIYCVGTEQVCVAQGDCRIPVERGGIGKRERILSIVGAWTLQIRNKDPAKQAVFLAHLIIHSRHADALRTIPENAVANFSARIGWC